MPTRALALLLLLLLLSLPAAAASREAQTTAQFIAEHAARHQFSGTILVREGARTTFRQSFGLADRAFAVPNTPDTRYKIASITKTFTATLILKAVEDGKLALDQPFRTWLPGYTGSGGDSITVHQLLNHTGGLPNFDTVKDLKTALRSGVPFYQRPYTSDQLMHALCSGAPVNEPGKVFDYNNADYIILGKILEAVHGQPFDRILAAQILQPLGMPDSGMLRQQDIVPRLASTYFARPDLGNALAPDLPIYPENGYAAAAMYSTVDDLARFADALFDGRVLKSDSLALMLKPGLDDYGYGAWTYTATFAGQKHHVLKRPGSIMGAQAQFYRVIEPGVTVIILSNVGNMDLDQFVADIGKRAVAEAQAKRTADCCAVHRSDGHAGFGLVRRHDRRAAGGHRSARAQIWRAAIPH